MSHSVIARVVDGLETLPSDLQQMVLDFVQSLQTAPLRGRPGNQLLQFAGLIPGEELDLMRGAVVAGCERVSVNEW
ncbi:MAG: hypothetical protein M3Q45_11050 [Chloroflexota bacterium]|nr:hypothetical protein [Chloroflexota bacterium]